MIENKIIKVCGMRESENIRNLDKLNVNMVGFIFYPKSPRYVTEIPSYLPAQNKRVGVFVNADKKNLLDIADRFSLNFIQLHGSESPEYCRNLREHKVRLIKAFSIKYAKDIEATEMYHGICDYFLFDTKCEQHGGSGNQFDWSILENYTGNTPFLLSGGINQYSIRALKEFNHPKLIGYDINSRFETKPGLKDIDRIREFITQLKN